MNKWVKHKHWHKWTQLFRRNLILLLLLTISLFTVEVRAATTFNNNSITLKKEAVVYITRTGKKYHRSNCRYLKQSKIKISLTDAKKNGYEACKVCKP